MFRSHLIGTRSARAADSRALIGFNLGQIASNQVEILDHRANKSSKLLAKQASESHTNTIGRAREATLLQNKRLISGRQSHETTRPLLLLLLSSKLIVVLVFARS